MSNLQDYMFVTLEMQIPWSKRLNGPEKNGESGSFVVLSLYFLYFRRW